MILSSIVNLAKICAAKQVRHVVLSPGSRCAPLTMAFVRHPDISVKTVSDERSAAFIALGMARQLRQPTALVCTSGSAAYNYAPAIAEAYFQQIPLVIFTADRPPEWIDQLDGQTIRQRNIYGRHVKGSYELPVGQTEADVWYANRMVAEAINLSSSYPPGPVHINVPVREPFYPQADEQMDFDSPVKIIEQIQAMPKLGEADMSDLQQAFQSFDKKLIVCGQHVYDAELWKTLVQFHTQQQVPMVADVIANMHVPLSIRHADVLLAQKDEQLLSELQPDLLITFGLSVMSKNLKLFLRKHRPKHHWHVQPSGNAADTFQSLTKVIHTQPATFFADMLTDFEAKPQQAAYFQRWNHEEAKARQLMDQFLVNDTIQAAGEFAAVQQLLKALPDGANLHLANSMTVRYANLLGLHDTQRTVEVFANRGTSGIDGSNSTAVGVAFATDKLNVLVTGDMAFFYDRNAFWHNYQLPNLRILLLNNQGGGIFRMIEGPARQPELEEYFVTRQALYAENTARDFSMAYQRIDLVQQEDMRELSSMIDELLHQPSDTACILEVITDNKINTKVFNQYKQRVQQHSSS